VKRAALLLLLAACGGDATPAATSVAPEPLAGAFKGRDVLVILLDALHAAHLSCQGAGRPTSPHIDALAARGVRFEHAWSQSTWTLSSTASLMSGLYQESHGVLRKDQALPEEAQTLAEAFAAGGWETALFTENPFASGAFGFAQGFGAVHEYYGKDHDEREMAAEAAAFLAPGRTGGAPRMAYVHFRRPHAPYDPPEPWRSRFADPAFAGTATGTHEDITDHNTGRKPLGAADIAHLQDLYEGGLATVDEVLGGLVGAIDPRALVVVISDHGDGFGQHGRLGHNRTCFEEMVNMAFIVAAPELAQGRVVQAPVMSVDLFPTLATLCGLARPEVLQGSSLAAQLAGSAAAPHPLVFSSSRDGADHAEAVFDGRWKYQRVPEDRIELLHDLVADPREERDLVAAQPAEVKRLRAALDAWRAGQHPVYGGVGTAADRNVEDTLRALGYVGDR
jgi:arylsulfatase A-like enzyme